MTTKHTPRPWHYGGHLFDSRVMAKEAPTSWSTRTIAIVDHTEDEMGEANAHLIAAAPDLLEACESLMEAQRRADAGEHGGFGYYVDAVDLARAAIAKAKGKA